MMCSHQTLLGTEPYLLLVGCVLTTCGGAVPVVCPAAVRFPLILRLPPISAASSCSNFSIFFRVLADGLVMRWLAKNSDPTDINVPQNTMPMIWTIVKPAAHNVLVESDTQVR